jgi:pyrimidine deaminase RibD-like protein
VFHHEIHVGGGADIGDGIARHGDDVREFAGGEHAEIAAAEQFGGNARAGL